MLENELLYIYDNLNRRKQVYNMKLEYIKSIDVDYHPLVIKSSNSLLFFQSGITTSLFIYELTSLKFKQNKK